MAGVSKIYPPQKKVLSNIYLSFFYGAKIGVLGLNGSGKSSLLRIIAGLDQQYQGEVVFSPGYTVGMLEQEPELDKDKTGKEIVEEGGHELVAQLAQLALGLIPLAWFTGAQERPRVLLAFSSDGGAVFGDPIVVESEGALGRVDLLALDEALDKLARDSPRQCRVAELRCFAGMKARESASVQLSSTSSWANVTAAE